MNEENNRDKQMAESRYSVVADLADPYPYAAKRRQMIREKQTESGRFQRLNGSDSQVL